MNAKTITTTALVVAALAAVALLCVDSTTRDVDLPTPHEEDAGDSAEVDIDLTRMNATMQATYTYRLAANPAEFAGKSMRISGKFLTGIDEEDGKRHYGCLVGNSAGCACCAPSLVLEFEPKDSYAWPTNYPPEESQITISGTLEMFEVGDNMLRQPVTKVPKLANADIAF